MFADVVDLRDFYHTPLGRVAAKLLRPKIMQIWGDVTDLNIVGLGYANPYLRPLLGQATRVISVMPAAQGVLHWPETGENKTVLANETELPFADFSVDRLLLVHCLEGTTHTKALMREAWRVLSESGSMIIVIPNRRGLWARSDLTPFGRGTPYTRRQLESLLRESLFTPVQSDRALFVPPSRSRLLLSSAYLWQRLGRKFFPRFSGVILVEARKQLYAGTPAEVTTHKRKPRLIATVKGQS